MFSQHPQPLKHGTLLPKEKGTQSSHRRDCVPFSFPVLLAWIALAGTVQASHLTADYQAFNIFDGNTTGVHDPSEDYVPVQGPPGGDGVVFLDPVNPQALHQPSQNFRDRLEAAYPLAAGWSYAQATGPLSVGALIVHTYDAEHPDPANGYAKACGSCVGAMFHVEYLSEEEGDDPADIHWIQVITNNHPHDGAHGAIENVVDVDAGQANPYYDAVALADNQHFLDAPARGDDDMDHWWTAELWLVTGPAIGGGPGAVTLWGGIQWGWGNTVVYHPPPVPEPATWSMMIVCGPAMILLIRRPKKKG